MSQSSGETLVPRLFLLRGSSLVLRGTFHSPVGTWSVVLSLGSRLSVSDPVRLVNRTSQTPDLSFSTLAIKGRTLLVRVVHVCSGCVRRKAPELFDPDL